MSGYRLPSGGAVNRGAPIDFVWQGGPLSGFAGDTLASALLAAGKSIVARSFKYHRPRGVLAAGLDEPNALVQLEEGAHTIPNLKATGVPLYQGLRARPVNAYPSAERDRMAVLGLLKRFIPAAFYYKTFKWPDWHWYEPAIRRAAGLGIAPRSPDPDIYDSRFAHCDVLVIGGGIVGLDAARKAAARGASVYLVTGGEHWGGRDTGAGGGATRAGWIEHCLAELAAAPHVTLLKRTLATGCYDHNMVALCERLTDHVPLAVRAGFRQRLWKVRAGKIILATGAIERPLVFAGNDRPGVMLAGAAAIYASRYGVAVGKRIVLATNNDSGWQSAFTLARAGVSIDLIAEARVSVDAELSGLAAELGISVRLGKVPVQVAGRRRVRAVRLAAHAASGRAAGRRETIACDTLLMSGGWNPTVHLHSQAGGELRFDGQLQAFVPVAGTGLTVLGGAAGDFTFHPSGNAGRTQSAVLPLWSISAGKGPSAMAWVDYQNDVTASDVALAARENFRSVEHLKRYTTLGMASDQGKTSNVIGIGILSELLGKALPAIGTTRFRPPYDPTTIGVFAAERIGDALSPPRRLAASLRHDALGATCEEYGGWLRPAFYRRQDEHAEQAIVREVMAVRRGVGLFEASPLGKIEVKGPDAAAFLDRIYATPVRSLGIGRCRYGIMLSEHGNVIDDGIVARLAEDHFLVGTTSGHASSIAASLQEWLQCEWPELRVLTEDVTTCWAVVNLAGPASRSVLAKLDCDIDLDCTSFPHLAVRTGTILGLPCRIQRVSFSGELSYEIAVPWSAGAHLWDMALRAGEGEGILPFGIEALMTMRIEKGFLLAGSETDGTTIPADLGFHRGGVPSDRSFIGRRSLLRPDAQRPNRRQLIGLNSGSASGVLRVGAHLRSPGSRASEGWVTSSAWSPTLERPVALGLLDAGHARVGETVEVWDVDGLSTATVCPPCHYDPQGEQLNV